MDQPGGAPAQPPATDIVLRLLGPVQVSNGQAWMPPRSGVSRALLAALALAPGHELTADALYAAAWGDRRAPSPRAAVQVGVHRLRRWLVATGCRRVWVNTTATGYRLDLGGVSDVERFRELVALAQGRPAAEQLPLLEQALSAWRGRPLADDPATAHRISTLIGPLDRLWRDAALACGQAALRAGQPGRAVEVAELLIADAPFDEAAVVLGVEALAAAGRPADALLTFHRMRARLAEELGADPSAELQRAYLGVLSMTADDAAAAQPPGPCLLPAQIPDFTGRVTELRSLLATSPDSGALAPVVVTGPPGVGKTVLAVHAAHAAAQRFPDGQLYADLRGFTDPVPAEDVLAWFLRAFGVSSSAIPTQLDERAAIYRARTAHRRLLVVLDNAREEAQVRPLLPGTGAAVFITSRRQLIGLEGARRIELTAFTEAEALALLGAVAGAQRVARESSAARDIVRFCGYLPLAVRVAAARLATHPHWTVQRLAAALADERHRLDQLSAGDLDVRAALNLSYLGLSETQRHCLHLLGQLEAPTSRYGSLAPRYGYMSPRASACWTRSSRSASSRSRDSTPPANPDTASTTSYGSSLANTPRTPSRRRRATAP